MIHYKPELNPNNSEVTQAKYSDLKQDGLIQHYIKPLLLNKKKFDIRCYLFYNSSPCLALFNPGYLRLTIEDYTEEDVENEKNLGIHLTNNCLQIKNKLYKEKKEDTIAKWDLIETSIGTEATATLKHKIKQMMVAVMTSAKRKLIAKRGTYELLGCDVIVGQDLQPYLLEVNTNPAMFTDTKVQKQLLPVLAKNTLDTVFELYDTKTAKGVLPKLSQRNYQLLYCEQTSWIYGADQASKQLNGLPFTPTQQESHLQTKSINTCME